MIQIQLTEEERDVLAEVLAAFVSDTRFEVSNTENMNFREDLKRKESVIKKLLEKL